MTRAQLRAQIQRNRRDPAALLHSITDYDDAINEAIRQYPEPLLCRQTDTTLVTVADTRRYSLAAIAAIDEPWQVTRVWVEGSDGHFYEIGRWQIELGLTLLLVLDEDPAAAGRDIMVEYLVPFAELTGDSETTHADDDWIIYKATVLLLMESDGASEDPNRAQQDINYFDGARTQRERVLLARRDRPASKMRTQVWS
jgi:hypothetical protein